MYYRDKTMTHADKDNGIINIENAAAEVSQQLGSDEIKFVLIKYGATSLDDLDPSDYASVFGELEYLLNN